MKRPFYLSLLFRVFLCVIAFCVCSYKYLDHQNVITKKRLAIPIAAKELRSLKEQNTCLQYKVKHFENPDNLMQLAKRAEFSHLKAPVMKEVIAVQPRIVPSISDPMLAKKDSAALSSAVMGVLPPKS